MVLRFLLLHGRFFLLGRMDVPVRGNQRDRNEEREDVDKQDSLKTPPNSQGCANQRAGFALWRSSSVKITDNSEKRCGPNQGVDRP
ncbi:hypothetical protein CGERO_01290 [Corynebacterium gerontici]|uniref:Uncharacterized protein n=1 Tax=Corynebacterium gerontici TaxID=2079234 RepID=A0A3G6IY25_9CORY|nr:hypothetical protein CGERO_01290 [Corynebacterium gerontici]